ncbi:MAG: hypothetical protein KDB03_00200 [Planctomycetales bacterium]|nr:hypothetical protein [Planctomycetales bacterium]
MSNSTTTRQKSLSVHRTRGAQGLRTQKVDVVASVLMSFLIVLGMIVVLLFVVWLTRTLTWAPGVIEIVDERIAGRGDHAEGFERDIEPPGAEDVELLTEPTLAETLEAVTQAATNVAASLESFDSESLASTTGKGRGDNRPPGPLGDGDDIVPRYDRWELKFMAKGLKPYASQLDFFKIELGCVGGGVRTVDYASQLASSPQKRSGESEAEKRLYFMWRQEGPLKEFDRQLLSQASITTQNRQILKFIPPALEDVLEQTEMRYAQSKGHNSVKEIAKTVFECQGAGSGYTFVVIQQHYRIPK